MKKVHIEKYIALCGVRFIFFLAGVFEQNVSSFIKKVEIMLIAEKSPQTLMAKKTLFLPKNQFYFQKKPAKKGFRKITCQLWRWG